MNLPTLSDACKQRLIARLKTRIRSLELVEQQGRLSTNQEDSLLAYRFAIAKLLEDK